MTQASEQQLDIFETITGYFPDGRRVSDVPPDLRYVYSIKTNLVTLFNTRPYFVHNRSFYGFIDIPDIDIGDLENRQKLGELIRDTIRRWEPRAKKVVILDFYLEETTFEPVFVFALELLNDDICRFRLILKGIGGNRIETVAGCVEQTKAPETSEK